MCVNENISAIIDVALNTKKSSLSYCYYAALRLTGRITHCNDCTPSVCELFCQFEGRVTYRVDHWGSASFC